MRRFGIFVMIFVWIYVCVWMKCAYLRYKTRVKDWLPVGSKIVKKYARIGFITWSHALVVGRGIFHDSEYNMKSMRSKLTYIQMKHILPSSPFGQPYSKARYMYTFILCTDKYLCYSAICAFFSWIFFMRSTASISLYKHNAHHIPSSFSHTNLSIRRM